MINEIYHHHHENLLSKSHDDIDWIAKGLYSIGDLLVYWERSAPNRFHEKDSLLPDDDGGDGDDGVDNDDDDEEEEEEDNDDDDEKEEEDNEGVDKSNDNVVWFPYLPFIWIS